MPGSGKAWEGRSGDRGALSTSPAQDAARVTVEGMTTPDIDGATALGTDQSNDGEFAIETQMPYVVEVDVEGAAAILFHRWSCEDVAAKGAAPKGSRAKKTDNVDSYVYRDHDGNIAIPGTYLVGSMTDPRNGAAKYRQDPRSSRKSALDLFKAGVVALTDLAPIYSKGETTPATTWDYLDERRVTVQRSGVTRVRPAFLAGWRATFHLQVLTPEYIDAALLHDVLTQAGRLVGIADFRPTFGRFRVIRFEVLG